MTGMVEHLNTPGERGHSVGSRLETYQEVVEEMKAVLFLELLTQLKFFDSDLPKTHDDYYLAEQEWRKFLPVALDLSLCEVIVPPTFVRLLVTDFPQHAARLRVLR